MPDPGFLEHALGNVLAWVQQVHEPVDLCGTPPFAPADFGSILRLRALTELYNDNCIHLNSAWVLSSVSNGTGQ